jgi:hypothetical protein
MRNKLFLTLSLAFLTIPSGKARATEYDPFIPANGGTYPTVSTLLSVEEGAINKILRDDFVKRFHFSIGTTLLDKTVRVGDVLEGHVTVTNPGMSEFTFQVNQLAVDVQRTLPPNAVSKMVVRMDLSLSIGTVFIRNYKYDWVINGVFNSGPQRSVILLDRDLVMDLRTDAQTLAGIGISRDHICAAIPSLGAAACQEYESRILGGLQNALSYLPLIREYAQKSINLSPARAQAASYYQTISPCKLFTQGVPGTSCPVQLAALETDALRLFNEMTVALEQTGDLESAAIYAWEVAKQKPETWLRGCAASPSNPFRSTCASTLVDFVKKNYDDSRFRSIIRISSDALYLVESIMELMSEEGKRIAETTVYLSNARLFGALDNDRVIIGTSVDIKARAPTVTFAYDETSGIVSIKSNTGIGILALTPNGGWVPSYLKKVEVSEDVLVSPSAYYRETDGYEVRLDLKTAFFNALHRAWAEDGFCISTGCPEPTRGNAAGKASQYITVWTSVGASIDNVQSFLVKL